MYRRIVNIPKLNSFFLFGARGTGKTELLKSHFSGTQNILWIDLLREGEVLQFIKNPNELRHRVAALDILPGFIVIDEVQRVPSLLNEVHSLIEDKKIKFALTGSSARKLKRGGANLLAGRALLYHLFPFTCDELSHDFDLDDALNWGTLPGLYALDNEETKAAFLRTYVDVYLREEIREEQIVRNLDPFARFLDVAAQANGQIINYSKIGRDAGTDSKAVARYFQILEETLLGFFLDPYHLSIRKRQRQQAKFYFFDCGVKKAIEGSLRAKINRRTYEWGRAFEHFIVLEIYRKNSYLQADYKLSYLRTHNDLEIDLIAERRGGSTWAIEIKSAEEMDLPEIRKLKQLAADIPNAQPMILCNASVGKEVEGVAILPWQQGIEKIFV